MTCPLKNKEAVKKQRKIGDPLEVSQGRVGSPRGKTITVRSLQAAVLGREPQQAWDSSEVRR